MYIRLLPIFRAGRNLGVYLLLVQTKKLWLKKVVIYSDAWMVD